MWEKVKIKDIAAKSKYPIGDGDHGSIKPNDYIVSGIPYIRVADILWNGDIDIKNMVYISEDTNNKNPKSQLFPGDIIISKTGATIGKVAIIPESIKVANTTSSVGKITIDDKKANNRYIFWAMKSKGFQQQMWSVSIKSAQPGFNIINLKEFKIPLPSLQIQKKISDILDKVEAIRKIDIELLTKYDALAQALFYDMFGDPLKNEKGWEIRKLKEISYIYTGGTPSRSKPEYFDGKIPWITSVALNNVLITTEKAQGYITEQAVKESSTKKVKPGSLCFGIRVGVGKCSIVQDELCNNQDIAAITNFSSYCTPLFLRTVIKSYSGYFSSIQKGATIQGVTTGDLKEIDIILPSIETQMIFDQRLKSVLSQEQICLQNKENINNLFLKLLDQYFS